MSNIFLYFLAIIPPEPWRGKVTELKKEFSKYHSYHALKSPPHITMIPPFKMNSGQEAEFIGQLDHFSAGQQVFDLNVGDFRAFRPRVIYLDIDVSVSLRSLHEALLDSFDSVIEDKPKQMNRFHPHMTIAFRDLTKPMFFKAWETYRDRKFAFSFKVDAIYLLKHNGKYWDILHRSGFSANASP